MTDRIREQLKRIGLTLSADWNPKRATKPATQEIVAREPRFRTATR
jgi:hypothetical protein